MSTVNQHRVPLNRRHRAGEDAKSRITNTHGDMEMDRKPVESLVELAYIQIRQRILENVWPPGHSVLEHDIAQELGMSRTPVREALLRVQHDGLIAVIPRHGVRVLPVSPVDMREIYEVLTALETMAVELVARMVPTDSELEPMVVATNDMDEALARDDLDGWVAADERFHLALLELAGNQQLLATVLNYWDRAHRARAFSVRLRPKPVNSVAEHRLLVDKLRSGDVGGAAAVNRSHRERASKELVGIFERYKISQM
jgi:DNA-binding GntR family transcriptional regulator